MHHCHPCFGGHKPTGPICTTAPVIHPTKQCVTHSFSTTVVPHIFPTHTTHVHHQQIKNQNFFPQTNSNVNVVDPIDQDSVADVDRVVMDIMDIMDITYHHLVEDQMYLRWTKRITIRTEYWTKRITIRSKYRTKRWWNV